MRTLREWIHRLWGTLSRRRLDEDLQEELRLHAELAADDARRRGLAPAAARQAAAIAAGDQVRAMDTLRDQRGLPWLDELGRDVRHGLRTLRRSPSFTAVALLTLALGVGANTAIYQLLDALRLRTLPVNAPEQLVTLELADVKGWKGRRTSAYPVLTHPLWEQLRDHQDVFSEVLAWTNVDLRLDDTAGRRTARGLLVSGDFFSVLGVGARAGRLLTSADDRPGCGLPGVVVSYGFWQRSLGGDPAIIGRTLDLNSRSVPVIGVVSPGFSGLEVGRSFDVAAPICSQRALGGEADWLTNGNVWWLTVMGRMRRGQSLELVNARLDAASPGLFEASLLPDHPPELVADYLGFRLKATPAATGVSNLRRRYADPLLMLQLTSALVLFIGCTNLANLVVARSSTREREFAVRLAVGGSRSRLVQQLMVENVMIALGGAVAGLVCATALSRFLVGLLGAQLSLELPLDLRLLTFMLAIACLTCLTFGLLPAWRTSSVTAVEAMKANVRSGGSSNGMRLRRLLVVAQIAGSLVLLFSALLFAASLRNLLAVDTGFQSRNVSVVRVDLSATTVSPASRRALIDRVLENIRRIPGIAAAAEVRHLPLGDTGTTMDVQPEAASRASTSTVRLNAMSPGYLTTLGMPLIAGRDFEARDTSSAPKVAIVNPSFVRLLGLRDNIVGQRFRSESSPSSSEIVEIIGLVPDSKYSTLREEPLPIVFVPIAQITDPRPFTDVMVSSTAPPNALSSAVAAAAANASPSIATDVRTFESTFRNRSLSERLMAMLSGVFGILAISIAAVGLYGVMSYLVQRRTNEIGVRIALGAQRRDITAMILGEAGTLVAVGLAIGTTASLAAAGSAQALVFGLQAHNIGIVGFACLLLGATAAGASYLPARRAARLPPLTALRDE
jgi:predicted permease